MNGFTCCAWILLYIFCEISILKINLGTAFLKEKVHLILPVTKHRLSSLLKTQNDINFGLVKTCVKP